MKVYRVGSIMDGGSLAVFTDEGKFIFDRRLSIQVSDRDVCYYSHPNNSNSRLASEDEKNKLLIAITEYSIEMYFNHRHNKPFSETEKIEKYYNDHIDKFEI